MTSRTILGQMVASFEHRFQKSLIGYVIFLIGYLPLIYLIYTLKRIRKMAERTLYFAYGSNIWRDQMNKRCPENRFIGVAEFKGWKWIINTRGYANIIPSPRDIVYGFVYELTHRDEGRLDRYEGKEYSKENIRVNMISARDSYPVGPVMAYIDVVRLSNGDAVEEYVGRINKAIEDGVKEGIPDSYFEKYFRPFIPPL